MSHHYTRGSCNGTRMFTINRKNKILGERTGRCGAIIRRGEKRCPYCDETKR